ncbi:MAG: branched-chain amino acid transport system substrate-binding protein [Thermodesulfobacteriota bacterium]|nr:branched-chain amino acid transport system substrate-binding protein [Thermodesulfobacteriota bacterium]
MKTGRLVILAIFCVIFSSVVPAIAADAPKSIKVGLMFGLTGAASPIGPVQLDGAKLAIQEINDAGGLSWGDKKIPVTFVVKDDETKPDIAIRRFREMVNEDKVDVLVGQTFASITGALNKQIKQTPIGYFPVNVVALKMFEKAEIAPSTFAVHGCAYSAGYASASYIVDKLNKKKIVFFGPAYAFGQDQWAGVKDALEKRGITAEYLESPVGTSDFTSYLLKISEMKPDVVMLAHWGTDAINVLKQVYETGLKSKTTVWFDWMTDVFGGGVPPEALEGVYSLMSWYHDLSGFPDEVIVKQGAEFSAKFEKIYGYPPDPYSAMAYIGTKEALRGLSLAKTNDPKAVAAAIVDNPTFASMKGEGTWRQDHEPIFKYNAFVVIGKGAKDRKNKWDLVKVIDAYTGEDYLPSLKMLGY